MKKRKLWIYGCSYSDYWGEDETLRDTYSWARLLANDLDLSLTHHKQLEDTYHYRNESIQDRDDITWRHDAGRGLSKHKDIIFEDILKWQPQDIVVIEESVRLRAFSPYLNEDNEDLLNEDILPFTQDTIRNPIENRTYLESTPSEYYKNEDIHSDHLYRQLVGWKQWYTYMSYILTHRPTNTFVWHFSGKDIQGGFLEEHESNYTPTIQPYDKPMEKGCYRSDELQLPHWDNYKEKFKENFLHFPWGKESYMEFICSHKSLFYDFDNNWDDHQSHLAHKIQAEYFGEQIKARMK